MARATRTIIVVFVFTAGVVGGARLWTAVGQKWVRDENVERAKQDIATIEAVVMAWLWQKGYYPPDLYMLTQRDADGTASQLPPLLHPTLLIDPWRNYYNYDPYFRHPVTGKPLIWSLGPPGKKKVITNWQ